MSLFRYRIDLSGLPTEEKQKVIDRIEAISFNGLHWESGFQSGQFFLEESQNTDSLDLPASLHLVRLN